MVEWSEESIANFIQQRHLQHCLPGGLNVETSLSYEEENALAGYTRNLIPKIELSTYENKHVLKMCLLDVLEEDSVPTNDHGEKNLRLLRLPLSRHGCPVASRPFLWQFLFILLLQKCLNY